MALYHYIQANGAFHEVRANGDKLLGVGYAGYGRGVNQPALDTVRSVGPIPDGVYFAGKSRDHAILGPCAIPLIPSTSTPTRSRSGFYIHGDNSAGNQSASRGCIVLPRHIRERLIAGDVVFVSTGV